MHNLNRKSPRLQGYDYASDNYYFVTVCTNGKKCIFGEPEKLSIYGKIADSQIMQISHHFNAVKIDKYVIMPNHIHFIVVLGCDPSRKNTVKLDAVIGLLKSGITRKIHEIDPNISVWQRSFHDHIIRNQQAYEKIWQYIDTNPQMWSEDCFYMKNAGEYIACGNRDFENQNHREGQDPPLRK